MTKEIYKKLLERSRAQNASLTSEVERLTQERNDLSGAIDNMLTTLKEAGEEIERLRGEGLPTDQKDDKLPDWVTDDSGPNKDFNRDRAQGITAIECAEWIIKVNTFKSPTADLWYYKGKWITSEQLYKEYKQANEK
jgi:chromosome segregation ATPase